MVVKRILLISICFFVFFSFGLSQAIAESQTNKFGIHISEINEAQKASDLVNSQGGEWGYVTLIINSNDRQVKKWQDRFNELNRLKLIPIIRIATYPNGNNWVVPGKDDAHDWAKFLNSLYWPTKKRLVVLYNEPNHASEWGGSTDPEGAALHLKTMIDELKKTNQDFFILNPGFDSSAPQEPPRYMDQVAFMDAMELAVPGIFSNFDGWVSHSYPNPGFSGKPTDIGRGTISNYKWELNLLKTRFKVQKDLPVYITETGWPYQYKNHENIKLTEEKSAEYMKYAFENVWLPDNRVRAVTPFLLIYRSPLFSHFSWLHEDDSESRIYQEIKSINKKPGDPERLSISTITAVTVPTKLERDLEESVVIVFKNTGNTIWNAVNPTTLVAFDPEEIIVNRKFSIDQNLNVFPGQTHTFKFSIKANGQKQIAPLTLQMQNAGDFFGEKLYVPIKIYQSPKLNLTISNTIEKPIKDVIISFEKNGQKETNQKISIATDKIIGMYTSHLFVPDEKINVTVDSPNRESTSSSLLLKEGINNLELTLPRERNLWEWFMHLF